VPKEGSWSGIQPIKDTAIAVCGRTATTCTLLTSTNSTERTKRLRSPRIKHADRTDGGYPERGRDDSDLVLHYQFAPKASNATTQDCLNAFTWILGTRAGDACQGANQNTRAGIQFADGSPTVLTQPALTQNVVETFSFRRCMVDV
jgi:hypothetical protein